MIATLIAAVVVGSWAVLAVVAGFGKEPTR